MSRIGNRILAIPSSVEVTIDGSKITTKGPKGTLEFNFKSNNVDVKIEEGKIIVTRKNDLKVSKQLHGTTNSVINNMLIGVSDGFKRELEINGVGYRFQVSGDKLTISAGYSHPVVMTAPAGVKMEMPEKSNNELILSGYDKQLVSEFASNIRKVRKPEPYKGKGIKYKEEHIRRKEGKKAA
jgi:ribosomal protein L6, bacterial type